MTTNPQATSFVVYRWQNPQTTSDYPYLAVPWPDVRTELGLVQAT